MNETTATPATAHDDQRRGFGQIDPSDGFAAYEIRTSNGQFLGTIVATSTKDPHGSGMEANKEYWKISGTRFDTSVSEALEVTKVRCGQWGTDAAHRPPFNANEADFSCDGLSPWGREPTMATCHQYGQSDANPGGICINIQRASNGTWSGRIDFYRKNKCDLMFKELVVGVPTSFLRGSYSFNYYCHVTIG